MINQTKTEKLMLQPLDPNLWITYRPLRFYGLELGTRMTIIRLADNSLFLHSPVALDPETRQTLDRLGKVQYVIAPNRLHHLYIGDYVPAYPDAHFYAAPGLAEKRPDLVFDHILSSDHAYPWQPEIDHLVFQGLPFLNEVVFYHRPSQTLLLTDLAFQITASSPWLTRILARLGGVYQQLGLPLDLRFLIRNRSAARQSVQAILRWDIQQITLCHGDIITSQAKQKLMQAWQQI
jgi:hypothetical protein